MTGRGKVDKVQSCAILVEGTLAPGALIPGVTYRVADVREHREADGSASTVIRFDPASFVETLYNDAKAVIEAWDDERSHDSEMARTQRRLNAAIEALRTGLEEVVV